MQRLDAPRPFLVALVLMTFAILENPTMSVAQPAEANYDEDLVPDFTLPDPLVTQTGEQVTTAEQWETVRRPELVRLFEEQVYGRLPDGADEVSVDVRIVEQSEEGPHGTRRVQFEVTPMHEGQPVCTIGVLAYLPASEEPVPAFLGLNFKGNHAIADDPAILLNPNWQRPGEGVVDNRATEATRGASQSRWAVDEITSRGYGLLTAYYGDIDPDFDDFSNGPHPAFYDEGQSQPAADEWGSIAAWAWGLSRILDAIADTPELSKLIDAERVAVMGHSRLGKTSLWAGASDPRFALVILNDSGCGGAALSRRAFGETVERINRVFPHWFCDNFNQYNGSEQECPVDQHELIALIAPRPVYVASAEEDRWADPRGEYLSVVGAAPVYRLLGTLPRTAALPETVDVDEPIVVGPLGHHRRSGKHDVTDYDWAQYLDFADEHLRSE